MTHTFHYTSDLSDFYKVMRENALETGNATREELIGLRKEADI